MGEMFHIYILYFLVGYLIGGKLYDYFHNK